MRWAPWRHFRRSLFIQRPTPGARTDADHAGEHPGQVTLISEAAGQRYIRERQSAIAQLLLGHFDAARHQPVMRRHAHGAAERAREMAHRQAALPRHVLERHTTIEVGAENFLGAALLPRRQPAPRPAATSAACRHRFEATWIPTASEMWSTNNWLAWSGLAQAPAASCCRGWKSWRR